MQALRHFNHINRCQLNPLSARSDDFGHFFNLTLKKAVNSVVATSYSYAILYQYSKGIG
ncbi:hypothetical protein QWZ13_16515 [Reinekea marina]|uniref:hypothetical protein n=1 Tax=Reinekea marina TaxID=1310421 RepID=UPI0025B4E259|nr:hypothetical protein [Reinekea marina]MDN3650511.1 hypothetical protein [Reinekea marina]